MKEFNKKCPTCNGPMAENNYFCRRECADKQVTLETEPKPEMEEEKVE